MAASMLASTSTPCNGTFVTMVSGARYAAAAACIPHQLAFVNSQCPLLLIYDEDADTSLQLPALEIIDIYVLDIYVLTP